MKSYSTKNSAGEHLFGYLWGVSIMFRGPPRPPPARHFGSLRKTLPLWVGTIMLLIGLIMKGILFASFRFLAR